MVSSLNMENFSETGEEINFNYSLTAFVTNWSFVHLFWNIAFKAVLAESELQRKEFLRKQGKRTD